MFGWFLVPCIVLLVASLVYWCRTYRLVDIAAVVAHKPALHSCGNTRYQHIGYVFHQNLQTLFCGTSNFDVACCCCCCCSCCLLLVLLLLLLLLPVVGGAAVVACCCCCCFCRRRLSLLLLLLLSSSSLMITMTMTTTTMMILMLCSCFFFVLFLLGFVRCLPWGCWISTQMNEDVIVYYRYVLNRLPVDSVPVTVIESGHFQNKRLYCCNT